MENGELSRRGAMKLLLVALNFPQRVRHVEDLDTLTSLRQVQSITLNGQTVFAGRPIV